MLPKASLAAFAVLVLSPVIGYCNTLPGPSIGNAIYLCNSANTSCQTLVGVQSTPAFFSGQVVGGGTQISVTGFADASGGPGDMKASASYTLSAAGYFSQFGANAEFYDEITVTSPGETTGALGYLILSFQIDGTTTPSGLGQMNVAWQDSVGTAPLAVANATTASCQGQSQASQMQSGGCYFQGDVNPIMNPIPFHFGDPILLGFFFGAGTYPGPGELSGSADYSETETLTGIQVMDTNMNAISNSTFTSASGVQYSADGVAPEPGTVLLFASAMTLIAGFRRFRQQR
jgi:hypothetical protein